MELVPGFLNQMQKALVLAGIVYGWRLGDMSFGESVSPSLLDPAASDYLTVEYLKGLKKNELVNRSDFEGAAADPMELKLRRVRHTSPEFTLSVLQNGGEITPAEGFKLVEKELEARRLEMEENNAQANAQELLLGQQLPAVIFTLAELQFLLGVFSIDPPKLMFTFMKDFGELHHLGKYRDISKHYSHIPLYSKIHDFIVRLIRHRRETATPPGSDPPGSDPPGPDPPGPAPPVPDSDPPASEPQPTAPVAPSSAPATTPSVSAVPFDASDIVSNNSGLDALYSDPELLAHEIDIDGLDRDLHKSRRGLDPQNIRALLKVHEMADRLVQTNDDPDGDSDSDEIVHALHMQHDPSQLTALDPITEHHADDLVPTTGFYPTWQNLAWQYPAWENPTWDNPTWDQDVPYFNPQLASDAADAPHLPSSHRSLFSQDVSSQHLSSQDLSSSSYHIPTNVTALPFPSSPAAPNMNPAVSLSAGQGMNLPVPKALFGVPGGTSSSSGRSDGVDVAGLSEDGLKSGGWLGGVAMSRHRHIRHEHTNHEPKDEHVERLIDHLRKHSTLHDGPGVYHDYINLCDWVRLPRSCQQRRFSKTCLDHTLRRWQGHPRDLEFLPRLGIGQVALPRNPVRALRAIIEVACNPWVNELHGDSMVYVPDNRLELKWISRGTSRWDTTTPKPRPGTTTTTPAPGGNRSTTASGEWTWHYNGPGTDTVLRGKNNPNDPDTKAQWHLTDLQIDKAWDLTRGSRNITIMIADTGVQKDHPDLEGNFWTNPSPGGSGFGNDVHGINASDDSDDFDDDGGHGTHMAGVAAAVTNNGVGVAGIGWNTLLVPCKFIGPAGGSMGHLNKCLEYAVEKKLDVVSMSFGGDVAFDGTKTACQKATEAGIFLAAASGDAGKDNDSSGAWPANLSAESDIALVSVNGYCKNQTLIDYGNYGAKNVEIAAPGDYVFATAWHTSYEYRGGTSPATPCVAGIAALVKAANPALTGLQIKDILKTTSTNVPQYQGKLAWASKPNALAAVQKAQSS
ncbi:peptidase S8 family domain protein [Gregarina niphandrodes]|uniref:subtilisin n=1 Tax=Gregarina niphandrodes TaxID=110365 RepID=A0A023B024_GRENI|nr:peptidase S8 family domain protein [Gregarina niphandrodes]EZG43918.1 peptidase S8 family domain protein [Gregarina niphandrodes]|eukprot:XP_011132889.1 peptidase S8 family domain protein [Gregarina niphandrodes]